MSDRYYVYLDDIASCFRDTYKVGDRLMEKALKKQGADYWGSYTLKVFELDQEDEAHAYVEKLNSDWNTANKQDLGLKITELDEEVEDLQNHRDNLERDLRKAINLVIRLHHNSLPNRDPFLVDVDLEEFFRPVITMLLDEEMANIAYDDGLAVYSAYRKLKQRAL